MRRFLIIFLMVFLPFQLAWGAAAAYCEHGTSAQLAPHFGHHEHRHHANAQDAGSGKLLQHGDCAVCHTAALQAVLTSLPPPPGPDAISRPRPAPLLPSGSVIAALPERPKWPALA